MLYHIRYQYILLYQVFYHIVVVVDSHIILYYNIYILILIARSGRYEILACVLSADIRKYAPSTVVLDPGRDGQTCPSRSNYEARKETGNFFL